MSAPPEPTGEHVLGADGRFHVADEEVRLSLYGWEDWIVLAVFWALAAVVFYQVFTRYVMNDAAGWTEEIARYLLVAVTFLGGAMAVRRGTHIQVDFVYRFLPQAARRVFRLRDLAHLAAPGQDRVAKNGDRRVADRPRFRRHAPRLRADVRPRP